jgi:Bacterial PH domain
MKIALIITGSVLLFLGAIIGACVWLASGPESGVKLSNQVDKYALDYLDQHHLLLPGERVIAYFDETIKMDGTEAAILTNRRLLYHKDGRTTAIALPEIESVNETHESLVGDIITVRSKSGDSIRVEIAPLNGGDTFYNETMAAWKRNNLPKDLVPVAP